MSHEACVDSDKSSDMVSMLTLQLTELEMLNSMFPNEGEIQLDDPASIIEIQDYINGDTDKIPSRLDFVVTLSFEKKKLEVWCSFPHNYPTSEPEIYIRSQALGRQQQHLWNDKLMSFINEDLPNQELCIVSIIQWLQEKSDEIYAECPAETKENPPESTTENETCKFMRLWIYSHHIYNKFKRRSIIDLASHLKLTGFCLPGKPGIICVEGNSNHCDNFWDRIKHMNWKKIVLKKREISPNENSKVEHFFPDFQEVSFTPRHGSGREYHMDMGEFLRYLDDHNCSYVFKDYFGVDGKLVNGS